MSGGLVRVPVPGTDTPMQATLVGGEPYVAVKPMCATIGIEAQAQQTKLDQAEWAVTTIIVATGTDGKSYRMVALHADCIPMWLATIAVNRVSEQARPILIAYQKEAARALRDYFYSGAAVNPRASEDQLNTVIDRATRQAAVLQALKGLVDPKHLELKARLLAARALGEEPDIPQSDRPLLVQDYLRSKGLNRTLVEAQQSGFGKRLRGAYIAEHGHEPGRRLQDFGCGTIRECNAYTEADRALFDSVWNRHYAAKVADSALFAIDGGAS